MVSNSGIKVTEEHCLGNYFDKIYFLSTNCISSRNVKQHIVEQTE